MAIVWLAVMGFTLEGLAEAAMAENSPTAKKYIELRRVNLLASEAFHMLNHMSQLIFMSWCSGGERAPPLILARSNRKNLTSASRLAHPGATGALCESSDRFGRRPAWSS